MEKLTHKDCEAYISVDVFKGLCRIKEKMVEADTEACRDFVPLPRCGLCRHFSLTQDNLGTCKDKITAYPAMIAKTCNEFSWAKED